MSRVLLVLTAAVLAACASSNYRPPDGGEDAPTDAGLDAIGIDATDACAPSSEQCNGHDDDCDLEVDEDFATLGDPCSAGSGACLRMGHLRCKGDGTGVSVIPSKSEPMPTWSTPATLRT